jgi:hypothetical protein
VPKYRLVVGKCDFISRNSHRYFTTHTFSSNNWLLAYVLRAIFSIKFRYLLQWKSLPSVQKVDFTRWSKDFRFYTWNFLYSFQTGMTFCCKAIHILNIVMYRSVSRILDDFIPDPYPDHGSYYKRKKVQIFKTAPRAFLIF